ncbi:MAG TPA: polysaccharide deacetylase family protein [Agriterribacter sp.]|nr:polysaccharide deacetylase family protein [Agriterribacter sp.]
MVFTGDEFGDGANPIATTLKEKNIKASFFLTGNFYRNPTFAALIQRLKKDGHFLGSHSDKHLLYCDWSKRDSLLITRHAFIADLQNSYSTMRRFGIVRKDAPYFLPPYEWYNDSISSWAQQWGLTLINFTPGTLSNADYTTPDMKNYRSSDSIYHSIITYEQTHGLNGFILLLHIGTDAGRTDKMYHRLGDLVSYLQQRNYRLIRIDELLQ